MSDQITLERAQEIDRYTTPEIIRHDIRVCGDALEALLKRHLEHEQYWDLEDEDDDEEI